MWSNRLLISLTNQNWMNCTVNYVSIMTFKQIGGILMNKKMLLLS